MTINTETKTLDQLKDEIEFQERLEQNDAIELAVNLEVHSGPKQDDVNAIIWSDTMNTSQKIKALARKGYKNAAIQKALNPWYSAKHGRDLRYQHVRNVIMTPTKNG